MKKIIYLFALSLSATFVNAQAVPNGSFETWSTGPPSLPLNWSSAGFLAKISSITVNSANKLPTNGLLFIGLGNAVVGTTGILGQVNQKFPFTSRPKSFRFDCMYFPNTSVPGQKAGVQIVMTKWKGTSRDTILNLNVALNGAAIIDWASIAIDLAPFYRSGLTDNPDTCFLRFGLLPNTNGQVSANALMFILDAAKFSDNAAGIEENIANLGRPSQLAIYPNPAKNNTTLSFNMKCNSKLSVDILDLNGRLVKQMEPIDTFSGKNELAVDCEGLKAGIYLLKLTSENGVNSTRLVVSE